MEEIYQYDPEGINKNRMPVSDGLFSACSKLGILMIVYHVLTEAAARLFYLVTYIIISGNITVNYVSAVTYLVTEEKTLINSTSYTMSLNLSVTAVCAIITAVIAAKGMKLSFGSWLIPDKFRIKEGINWAPACFAVNMIISLFISCIILLLNAGGISIPSADFTVVSPSAAAVLMQFVYIVVIAPIIEEFIFRGLVLSTISKYSKSTAILLSALMFGLMHGNIPQASSAFLTGLLYAAIAVNCNSIVPSIIIHSFNNFFANFTELNDVLKIPGGELIFSIIEMTVFVIGLYVIFTRIFTLIPSENSSASEKHEIMWTVFTNPAIILYLLWLVYIIISHLVTSNL